MHASRMEGTGSGRTAGDENAQPPTRREARAPDGSSTRPSSDAMIEGTSRRLTLDRRSQGTPLMLRSRSLLALLAIGALLTFNGACSSGSVNGPGNGG